MNNNYDWPDKVNEKILKFAEKKGLQGKEKELFIKRAFEKYSECLVPIYEPAGLLAAHSMGEPATQFTLRTKHYAGAAEVSIGSGIERLEELVDARAKTKFPVMTIYIAKNFPKTEKDMENYIKDIVFKKIGDVCEVLEDLEKRKIIIKGKKELLAEIGLKMDDVKEKIKSIVKIKPKEEKNTLEYDFNSLGLISIRKYYTKILEANIKGVEGITDAIIAEVDNEKVIKTQGTNFKKVIALEFVDSNRTYTNDIFETHKVLGIEAARALLVKELQEVYSSSGISIDVRHIFLLVDSMCFDGNIKGAVRTGIVSTKTSPLARAAFEQTEKVLFDAAFNEETEKFRGVVENVMAGLPINVGVGNIDLIMEFSTKNKPIEREHKPESKTESVKISEVKEKITKTEKLEKTEKKKDVKETKSVEKKPVKEKEEKVKEKKSKK